MPPFGKDVPPRLLLKAVEAHSSRIHRRHLADMVRESLVMRRARLLRPMPLQGVVYLSISHLPAVPPQAFL